MAVLNESAHQSLNFDVNINDAKAIRDIRNFKREMHDLVRDYNSEASRLESLGNKTQSDEVKLKGTALQVDKLRDAVKDLNKQVKAGYTNGADIEKQKKVIHFLSDMESKLRKAESSQKLLQQRVILFNTELGNLNKTIESTSRVAEQHSKVLQASGRETDSLKVKTEGYKNELGLLEKQQKAQMKSLDDYRETLRKNNHYSQDELNQALKLDSNYQKAKSYAEDTNLRMATVKGNLRGLTSGYDEAKLKSDLYSKETASLTNMLKVQTGTITSNIVELKRLSAQRKLDSDMIDAQTAKMKQIKNAVGENSEAYKRARIEQEKMIASASQNLNKEKKLSSRGNPASFMSDKTAAKVDKTNKSIKHYNDLADRASKSGQSMTMATLGVGAAFGIGAKNAAELEDKFNKIHVLMTTGGEKQSEVEHNLNKLKDESRESSIKYGVSQDKIVEGYKEMTKRGYDSNQVLGAQKYFLQAAIASGDDYNSVVNNGSSALEGFNMKGKDAKEMSENTKKAMNQLSYAADLTATDFNSMGYAMGYVASTAHSANQTIGDTAGAVGILSNNGIEASMAGTGLRKVLNSLATPTKNGIPALEKIGLAPDDFKDAKGNMISLEDMMKKINEHTKGMASGDKLTLFHKIFGATGQEAALVLSKNADELGRLNKRIAESQNQGKDGYVGKIAEKNMNTAEAQLNRLKAAGTSLAASYAVSVLPFVSKVAEKASDFATSISNASPFVKNLIGGMITVAPAIAGVSFVMSGLARAIAGTKYTINGVRGVISWLSGKNKKQESDIDRQTRAYKELTAAIKRNTRAKEINSGVDLSDDVSGRSSSKNGKGSKTTGSKTSSSTTGSGRTGSRSRKSTSKLGKLGKLGAGSNLKTATKGLGYAGMAMEGASIGVDLLNGGNNAGKNIGTALGAGLGMLIPIPVVDIAASAALGYVGGKAGDWVQKNSTTTHANGKPYSKKDAPKNKPYKNGADTSTADKLLGKRPESANINDENDFRRAVEQDEARRNNKNKKNDPVEWGDFAASQKENGRKFAYDTLGGSDSQFLKKWVKDQNDATMAWATTTGKSTSSIKKSYDKLLADASTYANEKNKQEKKDLDVLVKRGIISQQEADNTLKAEQNSSNQRLNNVKDTIEKIKNIDMNGGKGRQAELEKLNKQLLSLTDKGTQDQKLILKQLNNDTTKLSREREYELITASKNAKDKTIANAKKQYKTTTDGAYETYLDTVKRIKGQKQWTEQQKKDAIKAASTQYNKVVSKANDQKRDTVHWANEQYKKVVAKAQEQADDVSSAINSVTTSLGDLMNGTKGVTSAVSSYVGAISHATPKLEDSLANRNNNIKDIGSGFVRTKEKTNKEKNSTGFGDFSQLKKYNAFALGGKSAKDEVALMNEDGEESIYNRKKGTFNVVKGKAGLVKLHSGDEVLNADQTREIINNNLKRGKSTKAYAKGSGNEINIRFDATGVKVAASQTKKSMKLLNSILEKEYKRATQQSKKLLKDFRKFSSDNWNGISKETDKSYKAMTGSTNKNYKYMSSIVSKSSKGIKDTINSDSKAMVADYGKVIGKLPDYAEDSMKKVSSNLNKGISGINTSLEEFGGNKQVLKPIKYATGSNGRLVNDQLAMINDSPTDQKQEAVIRDDKVYLPKGDNRLLKLQTGDQVLNGRQTAKLMKSFGFNRFAGGSGVSDGLLKKIAKKNSKKPNEAYNRDFNANVNIDGSDLGKSITSAIVDGVKTVGQDWTKSMWGLIQNTIEGGGSGSKGAFLRYAEKIGTGAPYVYGGFDCSKLIQDSLKHFGIDIGRDTVAQSSSNKLKSLGKNLNDAEVGDLAYFGTSGANAHVGIVSDKNKKLMMNQHPPKGGISPIDCGLPLNGYYSVKGLSSDKGKKDNGNGKLNSLVQAQLGESALKWIDKNLGQKGDGGGIPTATGSHKNWLKQAGIKPGDYSAASEIAFKESSWNPRARNGQYYGIAQTTVDNYKKYGGPNWEYDPVAQLVTMRKYVENRYGSFSNAIDFRRKHDWYENGGLSTKHKMAEISEGNKPEMVIPLTNKSRSVELILKSLEFMFGNGDKNPAPKKSNSDSNLIAELIKSNKEKDQKIDNILNKMDILISTIQNKPVISEADIYKANKKQAQNAQRFTNLGKGAF